VTRNGSLVTRSEIAACLWESGVFVDIDQGINTVIRKIRYALRDDPGRPRFLQTVPGKGYRFVSEVVLKNPENGFPVNGHSAATAVREEESLSTPEPSLAVIAPGPPRPERTRRFVWLAIVCIAFIAITAAALYSLLHIRHRGIQYTQLTDFADSASAPALSPDGRMLAFFRGSKGFLTGGQLYVKMLPNGDAKRLTDDSRWKYGPVFSPDGSQIAYSVVNEKQFQTWTVPVLGGEPHLLLKNAAGLSWLGPDEILFSRVSNAVLHMGIVRGALASGNFRQVYLPPHTRAMAHYSYASPDRKTALTVEMDSRGLWTQCRLISLENRFSPKRVGPAGFCTAAGWSPDGSWMYFTASEKGKFRLWRQAYPNGNPEQLTFGPEEAEGLAVDPGGRSLITSLGVRESSLWFHGLRGDRPLVMEGEIWGGQYGPSFSPDGRFIYYLFLQQADSEPELWRVNVSSGETEPVFPGVSMYDFDLSLDGKRVLYSGTSSNGTTELCVASVDRNSTPHRLAVPGAVDPRFGPPGKLFFLRTEGDSWFLEEINEDGSGRQKVLSFPIVDGLVTLSPYRRWVMTTFSVQDSEPQFRANSLEGDAPKTYCAAACIPTWAPNGKWLYIPVEHASGANPGRSLAIPVGPGETLPEFPVGGLKLNAQPADMPGSQSVNRESLIPGPDPSHYAYLNSSMHRNIYRITLP
jgi:Tol biopolymer transport system component/DNA-binding winged helix-turn-helix (wHTH) protein